VIEMSHKYLTENNNNPIADIQSMHNDVNPSLYLHMSIIRYKLPQLHSYICMLCTGSFFPVTKICKLMVLIVSMIMGGQMYNFRNYPKRCHVLHAPLYDICM